MESSKSDGKSMSLALRHLKRFSLQLSQSPMTLKGADTPSKRKRSDKYLSLNKRRQESYLEVENGRKQFRSMLHRQSSACVLEVCPNDLHGTSALYIEYDGKAPSKLLAFRKVSKVIEYSFKKRHTGKGKQI